MGGPVRRDPSRNASWNGTRVLSEACTGDRETNVIAATQAIATRHTRHPIRPIRVINVINR